MRESTDGDSQSEPGLTEREQEMLSLERLWWQYAGAKETEIRRRFDLSSTQYYQRLNALLDKPEAMEHDPMLVRRLQRMRRARARSRSVRRLGIDL